MTSHVAAPGLRSEECRKRCLRQVMIVLPLKRDEVCTRALGEGVVGNYDRSETVLDVVLDIEVQVTGEMGRVLFSVQPVR